MPLTPVHQRVVSVAGATRCGACDRRIGRPERWVCPHCRADLREVGLVPPLTLRRALRDLRRARRLRRELGTSPRPVCGRCGYPVHRLNTMACTECGADLRDVGAYVPAFSRDLFVARPLRWLGRSGLALLILLLAGAWLAVALLMWSRVVGRFW